LTDVAGGGNAKERSGNGWDVGGELLTGVAVTVVGTNDAMLDANDIDVDATGGPIPSAGPAYFGVLYDDTSDAVIAFVDFGQDEQAGQDTPFKVVWHANGIIRWLNAA
jgi:hypothetical protein